MSESEKKTICVYNVYEEENEKEVVKMRLVTR